jgi:uncharacterized membrane protein
MLAFAVVGSQAVGVTDQPTTTPPRWERPPTRLRCRSRADQDAVGFVSCKHQIMTPPRDRPQSRVAMWSSARVAVAVSASAGLIAGGLGAGLGAGRSSPLIGWDALAVVACTLAWTAIWPLDATSTRDHAQRDDPSRTVADLVLVGAALASLVAVGVVLFGAGHAPGNSKYVEAGFALGSVFVSWTLVHTVFTLRYARLYYDGTPGGITFNEDDPPQYTDFAYLAFTIGMTFQVSDTNIETKAIRRTALRHAWISFPLGAVIISASINLISGLAK